MLLYLALHILPPLAGATGVPRVAPALSVPAPAQEERADLLRRTLFKTTTPQLLSHDLPVLRRLDPPRPVVITRAPEHALRELGAQPAGFTPYDRYLGTVRRVMANLAPQPATLAAACRDLRVAHSFRYTARDPYSADAPATTAARRAGDCKSKALWLYDRLADPTALYVIGKVTKGARTSHAWIYWRWENRWWILDPTNLRSPVAADSVGPQRYVPYYSFARTGSYRHAATSLLLMQDRKSPRATTVAARKRL